MATEIREIRCEKCRDKAKPCLKCVKRHIRMVREQDVIMSGRNEQRRERVKTKGKRSKSESQE